MSNPGDSTPMPAYAGRSHRLRWGVAGTIGLVGALGVGAFMVVPSVGASGTDNVTICHATSSTTNPYTVNTISTSSVDEQGNKYLNGHGDHTGPVFAPGAPKGWGDIIPAFTDAKSGVSFPGYNWDSAGQAIWNSGCSLPSPSPTPTSSSPSPTPTSVKVTICHATSSEGNPYSVTSIDSSSVDAEGNQYLNGHGDHIGPVFSPGMSSGWGDIIPPFTDEPSGISFAGYNWSPAGQAVWDNGCAYATVSPTPTPTETTSSPTPTPTGSTSSPTPTPTGSTGSPTPTPTETSASPTPTSITTSPAPITTSPAPITTSPAPITTSPAPITTSPAPITTSPAPITTSPAPITTSPAPITTSPAPITTSPAPTSSPSPTPITTPSVDGTPTAPAPVTTDNPNPSGGFPNAVPAGGGPGDAPRKPAWPWLVVAGFLTLLLVSVRQLVPVRESR